MTYEETLKERIVSSNIPAELKDGPIVYLMAKEQRGVHNQALDYAINLAIKYSKQLLVLFNLSDEYPYSSTRTHQFMIEGLKEAEKQLGKKNIPLIVSNGSIVKNSVYELNKLNPSCVVYDYSVMNYGKNIRIKIIRELGIPHAIIDCLGVFPVNKLSDKNEYAAYTIRLKMNRLLDGYIVRFPEPTMDKSNFQSVKNNISTKGMSLLDISPTKYTGGSKEGYRVFEEFLVDKYSNYSEDRNNANIDGSSNMAAYLRFGQVSALELANRVLDIDGEANLGVGGYLDELIVRRELAFNYCNYVDYTTTKQLPDWSKKNIIKSENDPREYIYSIEDLESANTEDELWNAAQKQLVNEGKMHGYLRMFWAKRILEWTVSRSDAEKFCMKLNDKYSLDGRNANAVAGVRWSIYGLHDRPWFTNNIFGSVRKMALSGAKKKFNVEKYIEQQNSSQGKLDI